MNPRDYLIEQPIAGMVTLAVTGTYYRYSEDIYNDSGFYIKANPDNSDTIYFGNTGSILTDKFPLDGGDIIHVNVWNVREIQFVSEVANARVHWLKA